MTFVFWEIFKIHAQPWKKEQLSARHMVTAALARAGKEQAPALEQASAIEQLKKKRTKPKTEQEPNSVERSERVANLIAGWGTPVKTAPSTPRQDNLPAKVRETRLSGKWNKVEVGN